MKELIKKIVPPIIIDSAWQLKNKIRENKNWNNIKDVVNKSRELKNIHKGRRIFIVGTGASIKNQNLLPLKDEIVIGLNEFFLHPEINLIKPAYNIYSGYFSHKNTITEKTAKKWYANFEEIINKTGTTALLPADDFEFIKENRLMNLSNAKKFFFNFNTPPDLLHKHKFDSIKRSYNGQSVSIMGICMAMFMGASEIYLLGLDHDWILTYLEKRQNHFYEDKESETYKDQVNNFNFSFLEGYIYSYARLFEQYHFIEKFAKGKDIKIINLTEGGLLDIFERKKLSTILSIIN